MNPLSSGGSFDFAQVFERGSPAPTQVVHAEGPIFQRKIIKEGSISLLVTKVEEAANEIKSIAETKGGFVQNLSLAEVSEGVKRGTIIIRVPAENFDEVVSEVKNLAEIVESENIGARDVTEQYIDLDAQLRNARAEETQYLEIMKRTVAINDVLSVSQKLGEVRGRIERLQGQILVLERQAALSTLTVNLTDEGEIKIFGIRWKPILTIKKYTRSSLSSLTYYIDWMLWIIIHLPTIILWTGSGAFSLWLIRWIYYKAKPYYYWYNQEP